MTRQGLHMKRRRDKGLCGYGGCEVVSGAKYHCDVHGKAHAGRVKAKYWEMREALLRARAEKAA